MVLLHCRQVFNSLRGLITRGIPIAVCLAVSQLLMLCGSLKLPADLQVFTTSVLENDIMSVSHPQGPVLHNVVFLFQHLLSHPHWLVLHYTLLAFRHFAEVAPSGSRVVGICMTSALAD